MRHCRLIGEEISNSVFKFPSSPLQTWVKAGQEQNTKSVKYFQITNIVHTGNKSEYKREVA